MLGDGLGPPTCVIGSPKVGRKSYPYHLAGSVLIVGLAIQNTDSSDSRIAAILNHRPEIHTKQQLKWRAFEEGCLKPRATKMACGKLLDTAVLNLAVAEELDGRSGQFYNGLRPAEAGGLM